MESSKGKTTKSKTQNECTVQSRKTHSQCLQKCYMFTGSLLGGQRVCENQDLVETEQLKASSRVSVAHVQVICLSLRKSNVGLLRILHQII